MAYVTKCNDGRSFTWVVGDSRIIPVRKSFGRWVETEESRATHDIHMWLPDSPYGAFEAHLHHREV